MDWATQRNRTAREKALFKGAIVIWIVAIVAACSPAEGDVETDDAITTRPTASLFAVGDTGVPWGMAPRLFEGQFAVGVAMQRAHQRLPIDAFVLLGDNFYPNGLLAEELRTRIVENVARPYCAFVDASAELAAQLDEDCANIDQARPKIFAVIGNHDLTAPGSLALQQSEVPRFVRNWEMPAADGPAIRDLPGGLSLIFLNSDYPWGATRTEQLAAALTSAKGPWRVIVGHRPPIAGHPQLSTMVARAAEQSGRIVHAYLAGHVHVMAAIRNRAPAPSLTVIAGSGAHAERQDTTEYRIEGADLIVEELGFLRLDVMEEAAHAILRITLFQTPPSAVLSMLGNSMIARYEIELDGSVARKN